MHFALEQTPAARSAGRLKTRRSLGKQAVAYIADPSAVDGTATLFDQKDAVDAYALRQHLELATYIVDSGAPVWSTGIGSALQRLIETVRQGATPTILVEHVSRFSKDYAIALQVAAALSALGAHVYEARGGLVVIEPQVANLLPALRRDRTSDRPLQSTANIRELSRGCVC